MNVPTLTGAHRERERELQGRLRTAGQGNVKSYFKIKITGLGESWFRSSEGEED